MKHVQYFEAIYEGIMLHPKPRKNVHELRFGRKFSPFSIADDKYLRDIFCKMDGDTPRELTKGRKYRLYAEFDSGVMISGKCFVVLTDQNHFIGFDVDYFLEEYQLDAKKYNL